MTDTPGIGLGVWPLIITGTPFDACAEWHDKAYTENSWAERHLTREQTDEWFLQQMLLVAGEDKFLQSEARFYHRVARLLGAHFWEGGKYYAPAGTIIGVIQTPAQQIREVILSIARNQEEPDPQP